MFDVHQNVAADDGHYFEIHLDDEKIQDLLGDSKEHTPTGPSEVYDELYEDSSELYGRYDAFILSSPET